jgi:hypothetical protein
MNATRHLLILLVLSSTLLAQDDPTRFANTIVESCGRTGEVKSLTSGSGTSGQVTTLYQTAGFEVACMNEQTGHMDVQLASNRPAVVSYLAANSEEAPVVLRGVNPDELVNQGIRALCSCATER